MPNFTEPVSTTFIIVTIVVIFVSIAIAIALVQLGKKSRNPKA